MKVFRVWVETVDYEEYDSCVIIAENEAQVRSMMRHVDEDDCSYTEIKDTNDNVFFYDLQGEIHIEEVNMACPYIVSSSFNDG